MNSIKLQHILKSTHILQHTHTPARRYSSTHILRIIYSLSKMSQSQRYISHFSRFMEARKEKQILQEKMEHIIMDGAMEFLDCYEVLDIPIDADAQTILDAHGTLMTRLDSAPPDSGEAPIARAIVTAAYAIMSNPQIGRASCRERV